jgi:hypothetical protein
MNLYKNLPINCMGELTSIAIRAGSLFEELITVNGSIGFSCFQFFL